MNLLHPGRTERIVTRTSWKSNHAQWRPIVWHLSWSLVESLCDSSSSGKDNTRFGEIKRLQRWMMKKFKFSSRWCLANVTITMRSFTLKRTVRENAFHVNKYSKLSYVFSWCMKDNIYNLTNKMQLRDWMGPIDEDLKKILRECFSPAPNFAKQFVFENLYRDHKKRFQLMRQASCISYFPTTVHRNPMSRTILDRPWLPNSAKSSLHWRQSIRIKDSSPIFSRRWTLAAVGKNQQQCNGLNIYFVWCERSSQTWMISFNSTQDIINQYFLSDEEYLWVCWTIRTQFWLKLRCNFNGK